MSEKTIDLLMDIGIAVVAFIAGIIAINIILRLEKKALGKTKLDEALHLFILRGTKVALLGLLIVMLLTRLGAPTSSLVTLIGATGAAIALALKDSLGNIAGGIIILVNKPFSKGDTIEIGEYIGVVDDIDLLTTQLHTFDNKVVTVPNGTVTNSIMLNYSRAEKRRVDCTFMIGYDADIHTAKEILANVAEAHPDVLLAPEKIIGVSSQGDSGIALDLKVWCATENYYDIKYFLEENVKIAFDEAGINIPYPQIDVHVRHRSAK
ncbi:small conductance mechanosensitive channel [Clostridiales Family XIII bacterium PM5-7]